MELILLRHGTAEDSNPGGDKDRELVPKGRAQARKAAIALKKAGLLPDLVLTSPLARARQTAAVFCETAEIPKAIIQDWLASGMQPESALAELGAFTDHPRVAIVGHEPDFSALAEWLLDLRNGNIEIKKGAVACLRLNPPARQATLVYLLPPKLA